VCESRKENEELSGWGIVDAAVEAEWDDGICCVVEISQKRFRAPTVPAPAEITKEGSCQHSNIELPFDVEMAVRLRVGVVMLGDSCAVAAAARVRIEASGLHIDRWYCERLGELILGSENMRSSRVNCACRG
jgi:hypothetical protein